MTPEEAIKRAEDQIQIGKPLDIFDVMNLVNSVWGSGIELGKWQAYARVISGTQELLDKVDPVMSERAKAVKALAYIYQKAMVDMGLNARTLARVAELQYEAIRGVVSGSATPSKPLLKTMCEHLGLDFEEMQKRYTDIKDLGAE